MKSVLETKPREKKRSCVYYIGPAEASSPKIIMKTPYFLEYLFGTCTYRKPACSNAPRTLSCAFSKTTPRGIVNRTRSSHRMNGIVSTVTGDHEDQVPAPYPQGAGPYPLAKLPATTTKLPEQPWNQEHRRSP
jgi:hypothetical protein